MFVLFVVYELRNSLKIAVVHNALFIYFWNNGNEVIVKKNIVALFRMPFSEDTF